MARECQVSINLDALRHNYAFLQQLAPHSKIVAMIKADAYGHGMLTVARALASAELLAVATLDEAMMLRQHGIVQSVLILQGFHSRAELAVCYQQQLTPVVHAEHQLRLLAEASELPSSVWLKVNTGMNRLGLQAAAASQAAGFLHSAGIDFVWMTHFANADNVDDPLTRQQLQHFDQCVAQAAAPASQQHSLANSAAIFALPESHRDWVRPGISLYGISPFADQTGVELGLQPVMQLHTEVIAIQPCKAGDSVGYCSRYTCKTDTHIAVLAIGYGDGYPRQASDGTPVVINGRSYALAGMPSMDMLTVDLGPAPTVRIGDMAQLWGDKVPVEVVARRAGTIAYELTCRILPRVERVVLAA